MSHKTTERIVYRSQRPAKEKRNWRFYADSLLPPLRNANPASSLHPGPSIIERFADGDPIAVGVINAWHPALCFASLIRQEAI